MKKIKSFKSLIWDTNISNHKIFKSIIHFFAYGFGSGLIPVAPGTMGTVMAIPFYLLLNQLSLPLYALMIGITFCFGVYCCGLTANDLGEHDHPSIVWDEMVGYWITMFAIPLTWYWIVTGFLLFRFFDIWKPWPVRAIDKRVHGGLGIMLDDVIAGIFAWVVIRVILIF
ncbi:MAG: phosphatidylglycerophosphatase A [Proteobacteria bacterium]|nr:phosphatidylglycerophosphatase A [Pseudomonadota bacterium]